MTAVTAPPQTEDATASRVRAWNLRICTVLVLAAFVLPAAPLFVTAWTSDLHEGAHLVHDLTHAAHAVLMLGPALLAILLGRGHAAAPLTLLAAFLLTLPVALRGQVMTPAQATVPVLVLALVVALHPDRARPFAAARPSAVLLALAAALAVPLTVFASEQLQLQSVLPDTEPHAALGHWGGMAFVAVSLLCLAFLAAVRTPGWRIPLYSGAAAATVVAVASLLRPGVPSSLGTGGAVGVLAAAAVYAVTAELIDRRQATRSAIRTTPAA
jgi:hypothetical protein